MCSPQVLTRYLQEVEDLEARLQLATEAEMFDIGIDVSLDSSRGVDHPPQLEMIVWPRVHCAHHMTSKTHFVGCCLLWLPCMCRYCDN